MARGTVTRPLAHEPLAGGRRGCWLGSPLQVRRVRLRVAAGHFQSCAARAKISRRGLRCALEGIVCQHLTVARVAEGLGVSWHTANSAILAEGKRVLIEDPGRFHGVAVPGVGEHVWRHTRPGGKYVTVIIDLTRVRDRTGPARLLDMIEGRSKQVFKSWIAGRHAVDLVLIYDRGLQQRGCSPGQDNASATVGRSHVC
ncbi:hypothetical protein QF036_002103 [Arthrobacter globiformis]|nr:hypothetical protein [Arthrobacter globiformis]